ncbi:MAG: hypothetical protein LBL20_01665 [Treponema sp.]|jgi:hypothetical protein|nr:hypothetical protein [Treponema sp.]
MVIFIKQQEDILAASTYENDVLKKLETMSKANLDKVVIFVNWLIQRGELAKAAKENRRPLLAKKEDNE